MSLPVYLVLCVVFVQFVIPFGIMFSLGKSVLVAFSAGVSLLSVEAQHKYVFTFTFTCYTQGHACSVCVWVLLCVLVNLYVSMCMC